MHIFPAKFGVCIGVIKEEKEEEEEEGKKSLLGGEREVGRWT